MFGFPVAEPSLTLKTGEIIVKEGEGFESCRECGGKLVDRFSYTIDYHSWRITTARCEKCGKRHVQPKRIR